MEEAVKEISFYDDYIRALRHVEDFLSDKQIRRKYMSTLPENLRPLFASYSTVHIDWRWAFLAKALTKLIPLIEVMKQNWDVNQILSSDSGKKLSNETVRNCEKALFRPFFAEIGEMLRLHGDVLQRSAHALEGCECHKVCRHTELLASYLGLEQDRGKTTGPNLPEPSVPAVSTQKKLKFPMSSNPVASR